MIQLRAKSVEFVAEAVEIGTQTVYLVVGTVLPGCSDRGAANAPLKLCCARGLFRAQKLGQG